MLKLDNQFLLAISRMTDEELIEYLIGEAEIRALHIYQTNPIEEEDWKLIDKRTDKIETIKAEILRRM